MEFLNAQLYMCYSCVCIKCMHIVYFLKWWALHFTSLDGFLHDLFSGDQAREQSHDSWRVIFRVLLMTFHIIWKYYSVCSKDTSHVFCY